MSDSDSASPGGRQDAGDPEHPEGPEHPEHAEDPNHPEDHVPTGARWPLCLHLDERDRSATVLVQYAGLPDDAPEEWRERGFNSYETATTYRAIDDLVITGWTHTPLTRWTSVPQRATGRITVTLAGDDQHVVFSADGDVHVLRKGLLTGSW